MSANSWVIPVDGVDYTIVVDFDAQLGKSVIRVNGRMAARPIGPDEQERDFRVGARRYILHRQPDGGFDIDIAPPDPNAPEASGSWDAGLPKTLSQRGPKPQEKSPVPGIVLKAIVTIIVGGLLYWGYDTLMYMRVPWRAWTGPSVRIDFPHEPKRQSERVVVEGKSIEYVAMTADYRAHGYALAWWDLNASVPPERVDALQTAFVDALVVEWNGKLVTKSDSRVSSRIGIQFLVDVPKGKDHPEGSIRGKLAYYGRRVYVCFAFVPKGHALSFDVGEFLRSIRFGDEMG